MNNNKNAFTLLELAIALIVLSLLGTAVFSFLPVQRTIQATDEENTRINAIISALNTYVATNGHLPCPASESSAPNSASYGVSTDCNTATAAGTHEVAGATANENLRIGVVPTRELNLPDSYMFDAFNNRISYTVVKKLATTNTEFANFSTTASDTILINDALGNRINRSNKASSPNFVAYNLVAHGENKSGAVSAQGNYTFPCPTTGIDSQNCANTSTFIDTQFNPNTNDYFDDKIRWSTYQQLIRDAGISQTLNTQLGQIGFTKYGLFTDTVSGTSTTGTNPGNRWSSRSLNTVKVNSTSASLSGNQIILPAGSYYVRARAAGYMVDAHKIRITDVTNGVTLAVGSSAFASNSTPSQTYAYVEAYLTPSSPLTIQIDHFMTSSVVNFAYGRPVPSSTDDNADVVVVEVFQK